MKIKTKNKIKMRLLLNLIVCIPLMVHSQNEKGIKFEKNLTWEDVKEKARKSNKYIFIDCFATWCTPCKFMDMAVYPLESVGNCYNDKFICIKVQMDTTQKDNEITKNWYADAHYIMQHYKVNAYPTFLYLSPDGTIVHRAVGLLEEEAFINVATVALDPQKQYYKLLADYERGNRDTIGMKALAVTTKSFGEKDLALQIAMDYIKRLEKKDLFTKDNIEFIAEFIYPSKDENFYFFYHNVDRINKVMESEEYAQKHIDNIIIEEEINPFVRIANKNEKLVPNWDKIISNITKKYGSSYADRTVTLAKIEWYRVKKNWKEYTKNIIIYVEKYGANMSDLLLNNNAWFVFQHRSDKVELSKALTWSSRAIKINPSANWMDTKANILYKLGRIREAIALEKKVIELEPENKEFQEVLLKMTNGEKTWSENTN
jgi:thioredoxin-related protein